MDISAPTAVDNRASAAEYLQRAAECRSLAHEVCNEGARKELLDLADVWSLLAETHQVSFQQ